MNSLILKSSLKFRMSSVLLGSNSSISVLYPSAKMKKELGKNWQRKIGSKMNSVAVYHDKSPKITSATQN